jgi:two-component system, NarL family, nitrate/nitrite response regulator NarL
VKEKQQRRMQRILLIDDHELFTFGLQMILQTLYEDATVQSAKHGEQALALAPSWAPDLVLMDWNLGREPSGVSLIRELHEVWPQCSVVVVSGEALLPQVHAAIDAGAAGFIPKAADPQQMIAILRRVTAGEVVLPDVVLAADDRARALGLELRDRGADAATTGLAAYFPQLSARQIEVLGLVVRGWTNKSIAQHLLVTEGTVKQHFHTISRLLGLANRTEAVYLMARLGIPLDRSGQAAEASDDRRP